MKNQDIKDNQENETCYCGKPPDNCWTPNNDWVPWVAWWICVCVVLSFAIRGCTSGCVEHEKTLQLEIQNKNSNSK